MKTKTITHVDLDRTDIEAVLKALIEKRTKLKVVDMYGEYNMAYNPPLFGYHFECHVETEETPKKVQENTAP